MLRRSSALALGILMSLIREAGAEERAPVATDPEAGEAEQRELSDDQRARELYLRGDRLYAEGDYDGAIRAFRQAYDLSRRPLMLYNLANAYERAGRLESAIDALRQYAPHAPRYEHDEIAQRLRRLEARLDQKAQQDPAPPPAAEPAEAAPPPQDPAPASRDDSSDSGTLRTVGWILTVGGGGLMLGGGVAGVVSLSARSDARERCQDGLCRTEARDPIDRDRTASLLADVGLIAGSVSLASGIVMLLLSPAPREVGWARLQVSPQGFAVGVRDHF